MYFLHTAGFQLLRVFIEFGYSMNNKLNKINTPALFVINISRNNFVDVVYWKR